MSNSTWEEGSVEAGMVQHTRVYFVVENLIFPRPLLLGISLKSALYWEIGMKSTALKRIEAFVSKLYIFFGTIKAMEQEMVLRK